TRSGCGCSGATSGTGCVRSSTWMPCCGATSKSGSALTKSAGTSACTTPTRCGPGRTCLRVKGAKCTIRATRVVGRLPGVTQMANKFIKVERNFTVTKSLDETGEFEGYASVFAVEDHHGDIIKHGAVKSGPQKLVKEKRKVKML